MTTAPGEGGDRSAAADRHRRTRAARKRVGLLWRRLALALLISPVLVLAALAAVLIRPGALVVLTAIAAAAALLLILVRADLIGAHSKRPSPREANSAATGPGPGRSVPHCGRRVTLAAAGAPPQLRRWWWPD